jgi:hypothetical protein
MRDDDRFVWLGWELRDHYNAARAACGRPVEAGDPAAALRRVDLIIHAADQCLKTLDLMEPLFPDA